LNLFIVEVGIHKYISWPLFSPEIFGQRWD